MTEPETTETRLNEDVVQHQCPGCRCWYESDRLDHERPVAFYCDCGEFISLTIPKAPGSQLLKPQNEDILAFGGDTDRLDTGMTAKEAAERTRIWWEKTGRREMQLQAKRQAEGVGGSNGGAGSAFASQDPSSENYLPSGIIHGKPWDDLTQRDQAQLVKVWHHFNIRKPDLLGEEQAEHQIHERGRIQ